MSESPAYVPPFARAARESVPPLRAGDVDRDVDGEFDDDAPADGDLDADADPDPDADGARRADAVPRVREGLPPSYRMRAEPHYVEALVDRSLAAFDPAPPEPEPAPSPVPASVTASAAAIAAATALAEAFDSIHTTLRDLPVRGRPLRDRVALELARAEATRGRWLADAAVVLQTDPLPALDELDLVVLLAGVFEAFGPENRLSGGAGAWPLPAGPCRVFGDERLLTSALGALVSAVRALIEDRGDARKVTVSIGPRREAAMRTLEVTQRAVRLPAAAHARFFDADWSEHPAGPSGALLLAAARRIAIAHGGHLEVLGVDGGGCRVVLGLPAAD